MCGEDSAEVVHGFAVATKVGLTKAQFDYSSYVSRGICHHDDTYKENSKFFIWGLREREIDQSINFQSKYETED
ncbi:hypothetical protein QVD17_16205 [Tagetes erecta]|uniref:Uncharacterized protein n=1 Tax=Tagetes erecta TaxID=13708 RepID=A0AAD8NZD3_TARER|nr:hypothetical protein QVD17_16205 [Tagetes erecta]